MVVGSNKWGPIKCEHGNIMGGNVMKPKHLQITRVFCVLT